MYGWVRGRGGEGTEGGGVPLKGFMGLYRVIKGYIGFGGLGLRIS